MARNKLSNKEVGLERLRMAIRDNIVTPEVQTNVYGGVGIGRFEQAIEQIGLAYKLKTKPGMTDVFNSSILPPAGE